MSFRYREAMVEPPMEKDELEINDLEINEFDIDDYYNELRDTDELDNFIKNYVNKVNK